LHSFIRLFGFCNGAEFRVFTAFKRKIGWRKKVSRRSAHRFIRTHLFCAELWTEIKNIVV